MFEKASRLQDPKNRITLPGSPFCERISFYVFKINFHYIAVKKSIIPGVTLAFARCNWVNKAKKC